MPWFAAHVVMKVQFKQGKQTRFPVWENIVLIEAATEESAFHKAENRGRADEGDSKGTFTWEGRPAAWVFAGVRKLTACVDSRDRPGDGAEVSYLELEFYSVANLKRYLSGQPATAEIQDTFASAPSKSTRARPRQSRNGASAKRKLAV